MSRAKFIDYYLEKSKDPGFQIDQIRKELESNNVPDDEIKIIVKLVDANIQNRVLIKSSNGRSKEILIAGIVLTLVGAFITIGSFTGLINMGNSFFIVYGPFFGGLSMLFGGLAQRRKNNA